MFSLLHVASQLILVAVIWCHVGSATATHLFVNFQPAAAWLLGCVSHATGLEVTDTCENAIASTAQLVLKTVAEPQSITEEEARWLHDSCFHQADSAKDCWKDFFWQYNVFTTVSDQQPTCTRFVYELFSATAASATSVLCAFSGKKSCLIEVAKALEMVNLLQAFRSHQQEFMWDSSTMLSVCPALQSTGCCATTVLQILAPMAEGFCMQDLSKVFYSLPGICIQMGYPLPLVCQEPHSADHHMFDHVLDFGNFTCSDPDWLAKDLNCSSFNYHLNHCPSSICDTYCGIRSSIVLEDIPTDTMLGPKHSSHALRSPVREILLVLGGLAAVLIVISLSALCWFCVKPYIPIARQASSNVEALYTQIINDEMPEDEETPVHPDRSSPSDNEFKSTGMFEESPANRKRSLLASGGLSNAQDSQVELLIRAFKPDEDAESENENDLQDNHLAGPNSSNTG